jgi:sugar phosphate permease
MCSAFVVVFFHRIAVGVVADNLMSDFNVTGTVIGGLGAMYFYTYSFMQIPSGVLADALGARKTVTAGTLVAGIGSIIFGTAPSIYAAYIGRLIVGFGVSVVFISILKVQSQWFKESEFGTISGLTTLIGNGGGLLAGTPLAIAVAYFNWRVVFISIGIVSIVISVLNYIIVRNKPEDMGLPGIAPAADSDGNNTADRHRILDSIKAVVANRHTWLAFLIMAGLSGSILSFNGMWGMPYLMDVYGFEKTRASSYITASMAGLMIAAFCPVPYPTEWEAEKGLYLPFPG